MFGMAQNIVHMITTAANYRVIGKILEKNLPGIFKLKGCTTLCTNLQVLVKPHYQFRRYVPDGHHSRHSRTHTHIKYNTLVCPAIPSKEEEGDRN